MKQKRLRTLLVLSALAMGAVLAMVLRPASQQGSVTVRFVSITNDATGARFALFQAQNTTDRLFVRGRSELERPDGKSNVVEVLQITNVDYLQPGATTTFTVPCVDDGKWRLNFHYLGQVHRREQIVYEAGWYLRRQGLLPENMDMSWLPQRREFKFSTEWVPSKKRGQ